LEESFDPFGEMRVVRVIMNNNFTEVAVMFSGEIRITAD
jgi:hypothetical protein